MSDTILRLHAGDPDFQADAAAAARARAAAQIMFPGADQIDVRVYPDVTLIDCGENLERIACPHCRTTIPDEWWRTRMDQLAANGWGQADDDAPEPSPCCSEPVTLRSLAYDWPVGFARFSVDVRNPSPWPEGNDPNPPAVTIAEAVGIPFRGLWAHV